MQFTTQPSNKLSGCILHALNKMQQAKQLIVMGFYNQLNGKSSVVVQKIIVYFDKIL
jgi:hypothetical protein